MLRPQLARAALKASTATAARRLHTAAAAATNTCVQLHGGSAAAGPSSPRALGPQISSLQQAFEAHSMASFADGSAVEADPVQQLLNEHLAAVFADAAPSGSSRPRLGANGTGGSAAPRNSAREQAQALAQRLSDKAVAKAAANRL